MKLKLLFVAKRMHENMKIENWKMLEMHSKWKTLWITNQTICKVYMILKLHFEFDKKFVQKSYEVWLFVSKVCIKEDIPRKWRVCKSKKTYNLRIFVEFRNSVQCQRDLVKNWIDLTISISKPLGLPTYQVIPTHTLSVSTRWYATISSNIMHSSRTNFLREPSQDTPKNYSLLKVQKANKTKRSNSSCDK